VSEAQKILLSLAREDTELLGFLQEQYPEWQLNPQAAAEALAELKDFGAVT